MILQNRVGMFFCVKGKLLLYTCTFDEAVPYGDFLNYPLSHDAIWSKYHQKENCVDFDYWPRGRLIYNRTENRFLLYYDTCAELQARELMKMFDDANVSLERDEHYQCHGCNPAYANIGSNLA